MARTKDTHMTGIDFMLGTLNAAAESAPGMLLRAGDRRIDAAFHATYQTLVEEVDAGEITDVAPDFTICPDRLHGDSETVFQGMAFLCYIGYVVREGNSSFYHFDTQGRTPDEVFERIPSGSPELFKRLGNLFLKTLNDTPESL